MILSVSSKKGSRPYAVFVKRSRKLFFSCNYTKLFWSQIYFFIFELFNKFVDINGIMVLFLDCDTGLAENILFGKYHIHKANCMLNVPNCRLFSIDLKILFPCCYIAKKIYIYFVYSPTDISWVSSSGLFGVAAQERPLAFGWRFTVLHWEMCMTIAASA